MTAPPNRFPVGGAWKTFAYVSVGIAARNG